jgi:IS5 family transposase
MHEFSRVDLGEERAPDESTILQFRYLMEPHEFGAELLRLVNAYLAEKGMRISRGTIVDTTIIAAPSSTKNQDNWPIPASRKFWRSTPRWRTISLMPRAAVTSR